MDNYMAQTIMDAGDGARVQLDASVKRLLSVRYILARIMIHAVAEYRGCTVEEAMACIEGDPIVSRKDLRTGKVLPEVVHTASNESSSSEKGHIYYDVVFYAYSPSGEHQKLWINVEGQKSNYPGYDLVTRGIFYSARLLSDQLDKEFDPEHYNDIKKVYSIWICMNPPRRDKNHKAVADTIVEYRTTPYLLYAADETDIANVHTGRYDLMTTILVNLSPDGRSEDELVGMLSALFCGKSTVSDRIRTLSEDYGFPMTADIDTEVNTMCNYSEYIVERTREEERQRFAVREAELQAAWDSTRTEMQTALDDRDAALADKDAALAGKDAALADMGAQIQAMQAQIDALKAQIPAV